MKAKNNRILFVITQLEMGGAQRFLLNFLTKNKDKYEIKVLYGSDGGEKLIDKFNALNISTFKLSHLKREIDPINDLKAIFEIRKIIGEFMPDDLFLLSSKAGFIGSLATIFPSKLNHLKVIYRIGGWSFNDPRPKWQKKLWINLERQSAKWKDVIILNNAYDFDQANKLKIKPKEKLVKIYNGLDPYELDFPPRDEARIKLFEKISRTSGKIFQTEFLIGTIANFYPTKGLKYLIETAEYFKNNDNVSFVVIGDGQEREKLESKIKSKGLEKKIFLIGQPLDAHRLLPALDIFVLPSVKEGFPWAVIEAMAAKIPVIATRVGAIPEIIENGKNGFMVEPANSASLADKIKELMANDHLRQELAIQGHQTVLFKFSEDKMIKEIESFL